MTGVQARAVLHAPREQRRATHACARRVAAAGRRQPCGTAVVEQAF